MKKLLLIALLALFPGLAQAQCNGIFAANTVCGNNTGSPRTPFQISSSSNLSGPGTTVVNDLALWNNTNGTLLKDSPPAALSGVSDTNVTITLGGTPLAALVNSASVTMGWAGTLAAARLNANVPQAVTNDTNVTGSISAQVLTIGFTGTLAAARLNANVVQAFTNDTNVTASITAQNATLGWTGTLAIARGGTGASTQANAAAAILPTPTRTGDVLFWNGSIWTTLAGNNTGTQFLQENSSGLPSWVTVTGTGTLTAVTVQAGVVGTPNPIVTSGTINLDPNYTGFANSNCTLAASVGSSILTVALKDNGGNDPTATSPCLINYRSATATTGSTTSVAQTAALSITTFATGASLGTINNTAFRLWVVVFNNAGTNVLALYNASTNSAASPACAPINENLAQTSVAISGSATLAATYYTPNGTTVTAKAIRILGFVEYNSTGLVTAGSYASSPQFVQAFGYGIYRPCQSLGNVVQASTTTSDGGSASTTYVASAFTASISVSSAANFVRGSYFGNISNGSATNGVNCKLQRGSTWVNASAASMTVGTVGLVVSATSSGIDFPNSTGSLTYTVYRRTNNIATSVICPYVNSATEPAVILLEEFMG